MPYFLIVLKSACNDSRLQIDRFRKLNNGFF